MVSRLNSLPFAAAPFLGTYAVTAWAGEPVTGLLIMAAVSPGVALILQWSDRRTQEHKR